jgi:uncharacterized protein
MITTTKKVSMNTVLSKQDLDRKFASFITNKSLELIIFPTEKCNFRCHYCYEDFSIGKMNDSVISSVKELLKKRVQNQDLKLLKIAWFGGEPLIAKDVVLAISKYAKYLADENVDLRYLGSMTTNGYFLNVATARDLLEAGVQQYKVSIDGSREIHDRTRLRADGKGTFDTIWSNMIAIRDSSLDVRISLRLHFSPDNTHLLDSLITDLKREFIPDPRFSFYFKSVEHLGGENDGSFKVFSESERLEAQKILEIKLFGTDLYSEKKAALPDNYVCYASKPNSLVIRANGTIGKCTVALSDDRNNIGNLQPDGTLNLMPGRFAPWIRGIETLDSETLGCPLINLPISEGLTAKIHAEKRLP